MNHKNVIYTFFAMLIWMASGAEALAISEDGNLTIKPYVFESSKKEKVQAEIGRLKVPENRKISESKMIEIGFVRFKSTSRNPGPPIVYLAGGPGGSGILSAKYGRFPLFMAMRKFGDVIALDQRGTGISKPNLICTERLTFPIEETPSLKRFIEIYKKQSRACADRFRREGVDLSGYNTNESADDLNDLRKALGAKKVSLWGISYGTHLALATIKRHEKHIDRVIMAGIEGPDHTLKLPGNIQKHVENLDRLARTDPDLSKRVPSLTGLMKNVLEKLEREPKIVEVTNPGTKKKVKIVINKFVVQMLTTFAFGSGDGTLPLAYYGMSKGDYGFAANRWAGLLTSNRRVGSAMTAMMDCHSGASRTRRKQIENESATTLLGNVMNFPFPDVCESWGNPDAGSSFRKPVKTKVPTLFISGTLDVRTPPSNAEEVRMGFQNSTHLIINGAVHSDPLFLSSPKIKETMLKFMAGENLPSDINIEMSKPFRFQPIPGGVPNAESAAVMIDNFIEPFANADHFSGVVLAAKDGKIIFEKAYGLANVEHGVKNKLNTRFGIASINKPMTSVVLLRLIEAGKIGIKERLSKYIPDFPNGDKITIEMLGRHTSGIPHRVMPAEEETIRYSPAKFVEKVKKAKLEFEPGSGNLYSSAGYATLARVLEIASGKNFEDLLKEYVFDPAGMNDSLDYDSRKIIRNEAKSYLLETNGYSAASLKDYSFLVGAGSVFSTAKDIYRFAKTAADGKYGPNSTANLVRKGVFRSNGSTNGFRANVRIDTEKGYAYVLVSNLGSGANDLILNNLRNVLEGGEIQPAAVPKPLIDANVENTLSDYTGRYKLRRSGFDILTKDGELYAGPFKLLPLGKDRFYNYWSYAEITFKRDESGNVNGLTWEGSGGKSEWVRDK